VPNQSLPPILLAQFVVPAGETGGNHVAQSIYFPF